MCFLAVARPGSQQLSQGRWPRFDSESEFKFASCACLVNITINAHSMQGCLASVLQLDIASKRWSLPRQLAHSCFPRHSNTGCMSPSLVAWLLWILMMCKTYYRGKLTPDLNLFFRGNGGGKPGGTALQLKSSSICTLIDKQCMACQRNTTLPY